MNKTINECRCCLYQSVDNVSVNTYAGNNEMYIDKLKFCIPQVIWKDDQFLCLKCLKDIDFIRSFLRKCFLNNNLLENETINNKEEEIKESVEEIEVFIEADTGIFNSPGAEIQLKTDTVDFKNDVENIDSSQIFNCSECPKKFQYFKNFRKHQQWHLNKDFFKYQCDVCNGTHKLDSPSKKINLTEKISETCTCKVCKEKFHCLLLLKEHYKTHKKLFPCSFCHVKFAHESIVKVHEKCHKAQLPTKKRFSCGLCNKGFNNKNDFRRHEVTHDNKYKCEKCNRFHHKTIESNGEYGEYFCAESDCNVKFVCEILLKEHTKKHNSTTNLCKYCGKEFKYRQDMRQHEEVHESELKYECDICKERFLNVKRLRYHKGKSHEDQNIWKFDCKICFKKNRTNSLLKAHLKSHSDEKIYECNICGDKLKNKNGLTSHLNRHSNIKPFICKDCGKEYKDKQAYRLHLKKKHDIGEIKLPEKMFICGICMRNFEGKSVLERHMLSHVEEYRYSCSVCNKAFRYHSSLSRHVKAHYTI